MKEFLNTKKGKILCGSVAGVLVLALLFVLIFTVVDGRVYARSAALLNLQGRNITAEHYDAVREEFPDIEILWDVPFQESKISNTLPELEVSKLSDEDVAMLGYLPYLKTVDARNCTDYSQLEALVASRPEVEVLYTVTIDGRDYPQDAQKLTLTDFTAEELELVRYLPKLKQVDATDCEELDLLMQLRQQRPEIQMTYNVPIGGTDYPQDTRVLYLSDVETEELMQMLQYLPKVML